MAETKRTGNGSSAKKSAARSGTRKSASSAKRPAKTAQKTAQAPHRREIGAVVCLALAIVVTIACFGLHSIFTDFASDFSRGMIGPGFYLLPLSLLLSAFILAFHDGRPVALRVFCAFAVAVTVGAIVHLLAGCAEPAWKISMVRELYVSGKAGASGGALAGLLAILLKVCITRIGALILLFVLLILEILTALNMTVAGIVKAIRSRPRLEYEPPKQEHPDPAQAIVDRAVQRKIEKTERRRAFSSGYDLPVDGLAHPVVNEKKPAAGTQNPVKSPDQLLMEHRAEQAALRERLLREKAEQEAAARESAEQAERERAAAEKEAAEQAAREARERAAREAEESAAREKAAQERAAREIPVFEPNPASVRDAPLVGPISAETAALLDEAPKKLAKNEVRQETVRIANEIQQNIVSEPPKYEFPPIDLLNLGSGSAADGTEEMRLNTSRLNDTLQSFGIDAHVINVVRGPSVTRYELELDRGVKLSKVTGLSDDIALAIGASGVRISAIPDKISVVGIEVPNRQVSTVLIRDVLDSENFRRSKSSIAFAVGKDIGGSCVVGDISKFPHMLIAGTTGSGKSVCMNSLIVSLLYRATPEQVRFIMVDPKMVELGIYNGIPHLLIPVVTDPKKAAGSLQWAVCEMLRRYRMMASAGVRDLASYNRMAQSGDELEPMPQIVVVIDELADLMMAAAKEVEESICRIAQMGRASGIHLVIATQRPSVKVITGLMKANIPSRIAFAVASAMESHIILDTQGAEKLVGKGDMLYAPLGQGKPKRVQGCFITDAEVQRVVNFVSRDATANYDSEVIAQIDRNAAQSGKNAPASDVSDEPAETEEECDEMLEQAVDVILETGQASVSMLQRRLKLGYARAARIVDQMEERGIVGPFSGSKPREIKITKEEWEARRETGDNPPVEDELP